jgi:hypothetical protein
MRRAFLSTFAALAVGCGSMSGGAPGEPNADAGEQADAPAPDADAGGPGDAAAEGEAGDAGPALFAIRVKGNVLVDGAGQPLRLLGLNHSGSEYACAQGNGIFDSLHDDALAAAMASWKANVVRVPLNEDCWLGINGVDARYSGQPYKDAITAWVKVLHAHGLYAIVELHWSAPGTNVALRQQPMPDSDHAVDFWKEVAAAYEGDPAVMFDLFNEPYPSSSNVQGDPWACWKSGCTVTKPNAISGSYQAAGMQALLDAVRGAGAKNVVMAGGLAYANDLSGWLAHALDDPESQLAASFHDYKFNACNLQACWDEQIAPVAAAVPVVTGEIGEDDCAHGFIDTYMTWADAHDVSYLGWTFNPWDCSNGPALVTDFTGAPTPFGEGYKAHLAVVAK